MKACAKIYGSYVAYHTFEFLCNLLYASMHCVAIVLTLSNLESNFTISLHAFAMYYGYLAIYEFILLGSVAYFKIHDMFHVSGIVVLYSFLFLEITFIVSYTLHNANPEFIQKYKQFVHNWKIKINNRIVQMKMNNYQKRLKQIKGLPAQIIPEITNFIETYGIQNKLYFKKFVDDDKFQWGCQIEFNSLHWKAWEVTKVLKGYQADALGVQVGWKINSINGKKVTLEPHSELASGQVMFMVTKGEDCEIEFEDVFNHPIRKPLEFVASLLCRLLFACLLKTVHDVLSNVFCP